MPLRHSSLFPARPARAGLARRHGGAIPVLAALVVAATALATLAPRAAAGELEELRAENATLRRELEEAQAEIRSLRDDLRKTGSSAGNAGVAAGAATSLDAAPGGASGAAPTASRTESEFVPMRRVSVQVSGSPGADPSRLSSEWMPARDGLRVLESIRLELVRQSDQSLAPRLWLVRTTPGGSLANVASATLEVDGRTYDCPKLGYDQERRSRRLPRGVIHEREERVVFAIPSEALAPLATARSASFTAGSSSFTFTDDHVSAAAALAARLERETSGAAGR